MTESEQAALMLKGLISDMPAEFQAKVTETAERIRQIVNDTGDAGPIAIVLVAAEAQAKL